MNDAEFETQRERLRVLQEKWVGPLGLKCWRKIEFEYWREPLPDASSDKVVGMTFASWKYRDVKILFNLQLCAELDDDLEYVFVHECCHALVNETRADGEDWLDHEERVVTDLAMILRSVRAAGASDAPTAAPTRTAGSAAPPSSWIPQG